MSGRSEEFVLGAERWGGGKRRARPAHIFRVQAAARSSLCGRVHEASVWNWFPGSSVADADCGRCLARWRALGQDLMGDIPA